MLATLVYIFVAGLEIDPVELAVITGFVLFLSFGAPNQPGSILIGMIIVLAYLNAPHMLCVAIFLEVFLGSLQNLVNVISDIVLLAEEQHPERG